MIVTLVINNGLAGEADCADGQSTSVNNRNKKIRFSMFASERVKSDDHLRWQRDQARGFAFACGRMRHFEPVQAGVLRRNIDRVVAQ